MQIEEKNNANISIVSKISDGQQKMKQGTLPLNNYEAREIVYRNPIYSYPASTINDIFAKENKKQKENKISPFTIVLFLFGLAIVSVLYISNILIVGRLLTQINQMQNKHYEIVNQQELMRAQINKLSNLDRIQKIAQEDLALQKNKQFPIWIDINPNRMEEVNKILENQLKNKK